MSRQGHDPAYRAYSVIEREGRDPFWQPLGAAFENSDGSYNVILQALPLPGPDGVCKIVLRPPKEEQSDDRSPDRDRSASGSSQRRR
ncbi:hypothetical protein JQ600_18400 [Bradyrhizobium sp. AUGA SZCCT0176]|uniref:hypothetical protein n=1 Tax=Bradyrhizobium sp. AUGA SZCCT0176 TaxID=2807664 RepID=UPI001BA4E45D|nr:hypothetical protein [Bradyrhizobium sp. AUGA SZCCT0176]MBR1226903.1 hypothetical protein [Bradyrhizobium sp. AUGA SZCCT0176]